MKSHSPLRTIMTALLVVAFGWGSGYLVLKGIEVAAPGTILVKTFPQKAAVSEADNANNRDDQKTGTKALGDSNKLTIMMGGDVMFDRSIRALGERNGYDSLFDDSIITLFKKADIVAVNLEGPITSHPSKTLVNGKTTDILTFTFSKDARAALTHAGIDIVSLANNHMDNFDFLGFLETQDWLQDAGLSWFGNPWNSLAAKMNREHVENNSPLTTIVHKNGFDIALIGYHSFQFGIDTVISEIKRVSGSHVFTIVIPHWGEEYTSKPSDSMKSQARTFIAAGADAVIGAHPHVIMEDEWVGAVPVYYSLGNLLFDQYFSPEVMKGLIVEMHLSKDAGGIHLDNLETHITQLKSGKGVVLVE